MLRLGKRGKIVAKLALSLVVLGLLFSQIDRQTAVETLLRADPALLSLSLLAMVADRVWMAWKWRMLIAIMAPPPSLYEAVRVYYVSNFQGIALPLGGLGPDLVRYAHLRSSSTPRQVVAVSIVLERIIGLMATIAIAMAAVVVLMGLLDQTHQVEAIVRWTLVGGGVGLTVLAGLVFSRQLHRIVGLGLSRSSLVGRHAAVGRIVEALEQSGKSRGVLVTNVLLSALEQLFPVVAYTFGAMAFEIPLGFVECFAVVPISTLLQRLPISYAGLGIREGSLVFLLGLLGIAYSEALVLSSTMFVVYVVSLSLGGLWGLLAPGASDREPSDPRPGE